MCIIDKIVELAEQKSISQQTICDSLGIKSGTFSTWKARKSDPPAKYIACICEVLGVSIEYLLTGKENISSPQISKEKQEILDLYDKLSERKKGEVIGFIKGILNEQNDKSVKRKGA